jgi:hypothetical protein
LMALKASRLKCKLKTKFKLSKPYRHFLVKTRSLTYFQSS